MPASKYPKPKILVVDLPPACTAALRSAGYNVATGTFGTPYAVPRSDSLCPVMTNSCSLPNSEEQEIIIASTACPDPDETMKGEKAGEGVDHVWQSAVHGDIDPRPLVMRMVRPAFDRIRRSGGIFIVLLSHKYYINYIYGSWTGYHGVSQRDRLREANWGFISDLDSFESHKALGEEIIFNPKAKALTDLLSRGARDAQYRCTIAPQYSEKKNWHSLATDKFGNCIAGILLQDDPPRFLLMLPEMPALDRIILPLLRFAKVM